MRERLEELLDVKSLMTLALTGGFISLTCAGRITGDQFLTIFTMITGFYFGAQVHRSASKEKYKAWSSLPAYLQTAESFLLCLKKNKPPAMQGEGSSLDKRAPVLK